MPLGAVTTTVTAKLGPGNSVTSLSLANVSNLSFDFVNGTFQVTYGTDPKIQSFAYADVATVTWTPSAKTVVIST